VEAVRLAVHVLERVRHDREIARAADDRPADQVRVGNLLPRRREPGVELLDSCIQHLDPDLAVARGSWHQPRISHYLVETATGARRPCPVRASTRALYSRTPSRPPARISARCA